MLVIAEEFPFRAYVAALDSSSVTLAWGRADGKTRNTIGREAESPGQAVVRINGQSIPTKQSWLRVGNLKPDGVYPYSISLNGVDIAAGAIRTWPAKAETLTFFVIGDFGNGEKVQYAIAARMEEERLRREKSNQHVRFVFSMGDNIYGQLSASGAQDRDWERKFFAPYANTLRAIPFLAVLGNHDGNESERTADLEVCLDNFFMPDRWYRFEYASFVEFVALDSTRNSTSGRPAPVYLPDSPQSKWLAATLAKPAPPWRLAVIHHPMFTAGPNHEPFLSQAPHWFQALRDSGVQVVFSGHEHNLQFSERNDKTGRMQFVVSGAGGELRPSSVRRNMAQQQIASWSNQNHFLVVTISGNRMNIEPIGTAPIALLDSKGKAATQPVVVDSNR